MYDCVNSYFLYRLESKLSDTETQLEITYLLEGVAREQVRFESWVEGQNVLSAIEDTIFFFFLKIQNIKDKCFYMWKLSRFLSEIQTNKNFEKDETYIKLDVTWSIV